MFQALDWAGIYLVSVGGVGYEGNVPSFPSALKSIKVCDIYL